MFQRIGKEHCSHVNPLRLLFFRCSVVQRFGFPGSEFRVPSSEFRVPGSEFRVPSSGFRVPRSEFRVPSSEFRVPGSGFRVPGSGFRVPSSETGPVAARQARGPSRDRLEPDGRLARIVFRGREPSHGNGRRGSDRFGDGTICGTEGQEKRSKIFAGRGVFSLDPTFNGRPHSYGLKDEFSGTGEQSECGDPGVRVERLVAGFTPPDESILKPFFSGDLISRLFFRVYCSGGTIVPFTFWQELPHSCDDGNLFFP